MDNVRWDKERITRVREAVGRVLATDNEPKTMEDIERMMHDVDECIRSLPSALHEIERLSGEVETLAFLQRGGSEPPTGGAARP